MNVFHIQLKEKHSSGRYIWLIFETEYPTVEALAEALNSGKLVTGFELVTRFCHDMPNEREVIDARDIALRLPDIHRIGTPHWGLFRLED